jgi:Dullard-like phosphatase family protein
MKSNIKQLFQKSLKINSIFNESEKKIPSSNESQTSEESHVSNIKEFQKQCSNICIFPLSIRENYSGNYSKYVETSLTHISQLKDINFELALENPLISKGVPKLSCQKKILLLDLDETLVHADFSEEFVSDKYDAIIKFKIKNEEKEKSGDDCGDDDSTWIGLGSEIEDNEECVGIFIRNGVKTFLEEVSKYFDVGIFTASVKEYADAVIEYLDPDNKYIKYRLYRNNCINFNDSFYVKDLRIFQDIDFRKIILIDNSMYSFAAQINNGILINSFFNDKNDNELNNALEYLMNFILPAEDVREVNEKFFNFEQIIHEIISCN